ncbi:MAG TPA: DNA-binding protein [Ruminococcaceae bacterium]|nr:DUF134 domain-containing protein [Oscillospiraceae bacterium]HCM24846.1 DNA-binding protein [Oscillospiraceae bacterium]
MPRPQKKRHVCCMPKHCLFLPNKSSAAESVVLTVDEYETIRLIDLEDYTQEECAQQMHIGRTTVQSIYNEARKKIADVLVNGKVLKISGGDYVLCKSYGKLCGGGCRRHCHENQYFDQMISEVKRMKIAVTYENGQVFQHFGHTKTFKFYDVQDGKMTGAEVVDTMGSGHGALAGFLTAHHANILICGGIGGGAQTALAEAGIKIYGGVSGSADDAVQALLSNSLQFDPNVHCDHHDQRHGEGHTCGEHGCGQNQD